MLKNGIKMDETKGEKIVYNQQSCTDRSVMDSFLGGKKAKQVGQQQLNKK